jgi:hypothetical protein
LRHRRRAWHEDRRAPRFTKMSSDIWRINRRRNHRPGSCCCTLATAAKSESRAKMRDFCIPCKIATVAACSA